MNTPRSHLIFLLLGRISEWADWRHLNDWKDDNGLLPGDRCDDCNVLLAYQLQKSLVINLTTNDRGLRRARFAVLRTAEKPAVLIEGGFLSDSIEQKIITDPKYRDQMAAAIVQGGLAYQHAVELEPTPSAGPIRCQRGFGFAARLSEDDWLGKPSTAEDK